MQIDELVCRINALAKKQKTIGLTSEEAEEQLELRRLYLQNIHAQLTGELEHIVIQEQDGTRRPLKKHQVH